MVCECCKEEMTCFRRLMMGTHDWMDCFCNCEDDFQLNEKIKYCPYCGRPLNGTAEKKRVFSKEKFIEDMGYEYYSATPSIPNWVDICDGKEIYIDSNGGRKIQMGEIKDELWDYSSLEDWEDEV